MQNYFKKIFNLVKQDIKNSSNMNIGVKSKSKKGKIFGTIFVLIFLFGYIAVYGYYLSKDAISELAKIGLQNYFVIMIMVIAFILVIFSSFSRLMSNKNKDNTEKFIDVLPVTSKQRYIAKNITQILYAYYSVGMMLVVPIIYFGISQGLDFLFYLRTILAFLILPIFPTLILYAVMSFIKLVLELVTKGKTESVVYFIMFALIIYVYYITMFKMRSEGSTMAYLVNLISSSEKSIYMVLPIKFTDIIFGKNIWINLLEIIGMNIITFVILSNTIGNFKVNKKGLISSLLNKVNVFKYNKKELEKINDKKENVKIDIKKADKKNNWKNISFKQKSKSKTYIKREFSTFTRNVILASNTILVPIIMPIVMILVMCFMFAGDYSSFLKEKNKIYVVSTLEVENLNKISENKDEKDLEEFKKLAAETLYYGLYSESEMKRAKSSKKSLEKANANISLEVIKNKIDETKDPSEKEMYLSLKKNIEENINKLEKQNEDEEINKDDYITILSFENMNKENLINIREKNMLELKKLQNAGKIHLIDEEEKNKQKENDKYKEFAKYELPTSLLNRYIDCEKKIEVNSAFKYGINNIKEMRENTNFNDVPKEWQYLIPVFVISFIVFSLQMSIFMFSKEKNNITFLKTIPVSYKNQIKYKKIPGITTALGSLLSYIIIGELLLNVKMYKSIYFILGVIMAIIITILFNNIEILLDLSSPNFNWKNTTELAKGGTKLFLNYVIKLVLLGLFIFMGVYFVERVKLLSFVSFLIIMSVIITILCIISEVFVNTKGSKMFSKI